VSGRPSCGQKLVASIGRERARRLLNTSAGVVEVVLQQERCVTGSHILLQASQQALQGFLAQWLLAGEDALAGLV
jgi:hypothetical protein